MKSGLFKKYFTIYAMTLVVCTFMLGIILLYFASQYFRDDKQATLQYAAEKGVTFTVANTAYVSGQYLLNTNVEEYYELIQNSSDATLFFCDATGAVKACSERDDCVHKSYLVPQSILSSIWADGYYAEVGYLGGFYKNQANYTYALPVIDGDVLIGFVFASNSVQTLFSFLLQIGLMFLISSLIMLLGSSVVIYYATRILTRPLREISQAAQALGAGDFSSRVYVEGDDEIARLADVFNKMADSLDELETTRRSFVANVSHELRTPMTTIGGYIDGMLDGTITPDKQEHYLQVVSNEVKRLSRLTTSLLNIARMEAGEQTAQIKNYNAWSIILDVLLNAERRVTEKNITIGELDTTPRYVMCDADMLHQVVYNLVDNALKFTPEHGEITLLVEPDGDETKIKIRNSGGGIPTKELSRIFQRFYKIDKSRGLDKTGTGLGLYISKTLALRMGGDLFADSVVGEYTEFMVVLPTGAEPKDKRRTSQLARQDTEISEKEKWLKRFSKPDGEEGDADDGQRKSRQKPKPDPKQKRQRPTPKQDDKDA